MRTEWYDPAAEEPPDDEPVEVIYRIAREFWSDTVQGAVVRADVHERTVGKWTLLDSETMTYGWELPFLLYSPWDYQDAVVAWRMLPKVGEPWKSVRKEERQAARSELAQKEAALRSVE